MHGGGGSVMGDHIMNETDTAPDVQPSWKRDRRQIITHKIHNCSFVWSAEIRLCNLGSDV